MSAHQQNKKPDDWRRGLSEAGPYLGLGAQLGFTVVFFTAMGYLIDRWLGTLPWFLLGGAALGMVAMFVQLIRVSREMGEQALLDRKRRQRARREREDDGA